MSQAQERLKRRREKLEARGKDRLRGIESVKSQSIEDVQVAYASDQVDTRVEEILATEEPVPLLGVSKTMDAGAVDLGTAPAANVEPAVQSKTRIMSLRTLLVCLLGGYLLFCYPDAHAWIHAPVKDAHPLPIAEGVSVWIIFTSLQCVFGVQDWISVRESGYEWMDSYLPVSLLNVWRVLKRVLKVLDGVYGDIYTLVFVLGLGIYTKLV